MAKVKMSSITVVAIRNERKKLLEYLQRQSIIDLSREDDEQNKEYQRIDTAASVSQFERNAAACDKAVEILRAYNPKSGGLLSSFSGRRIVTDEQYNEAVNKSSDIMAVCREVLRCDKQITENAADKARYSARVEMLKPWQKLDVSQQFSGTKRTTGFVGVVPKEWTEAELSAAIAEKAPDKIFSLEVISSSVEQTSIFLICPKADAEAIYEALREKGFMRPPQATTKTPSVKIEELMAKSVALDKQDEELKVKLLELSSSVEDIELVSDYFMSRADKYRALADVDHLKRTFIIKGYVATDEAEALKAELEAKFLAAVTIEEADGDEVPVAIKNNAFTAPAAGLTELYSMPSKTDIDPTPIMSFFYYFFFGMMLSDAAYGLLLALGAWFLIKKCKPEKKMENTLRLFIYCGISTVIWGIIFGSFFGDAIWVISETFFGKTLPPWPINPMNQAIELFLVSVAMGFVVILTGLIAKFVNTIRNDGVVAAIFETGSWIIIMLGIAVLAVGIFIGLNILVTVGAVAAIIGALLVVSNGIRVKGIGGILSGLGGLYDITGYVSDLMSFSRLMALGLTTAAMGQVFNLLGAMGGRSIAGALLMFVIFTVGHLLSFALNALGAYVHTLRLQYVELFGKFYEGGGKPFKPFAHKSKYTRFKEDK